MSPSEPKGASLFRAFWLTSVLGSLALLVFFLSDGLENLSGADPKARNPVEQLASLMERGDSTKTIAEESPGWKSGGATASPGLASVDEMTERLAARLKQNANDVEGWRMLGWSYFHVGRFLDSAAAYEKAVMLMPDNAAIRGAHIESLVGAADGQVTAAVQQAIDRTLKLDPAEPRTRYFNGLSKKQAGNREAALEEWIALLAGSNTAEAWYSDVLETATQLGREIGINVEGRIGRTPLIAAPRPTDQATASATIASKGPTREDIKGAEALAPAERGAMIQGMVDGLADRLAKDPRDAAGWIQLIRSRIVLGERNLAERALNDALAVFKDDPVEQRRISEMASMMGISSR
jgi:cytochrome c-type biogenesis protein CcmH